MEAMVEEVGEVLARSGRVGEGVQDKASPWVVGGRGEGPLEGSPGGVQLALGDVGVLWFFGGGAFRREWRWWFRDGWVELEDLGSVIVGGCSCDMCLRRSRRESMVLAGDAVCGLRDGR